MDRRVFVAILTSVVAVGLVVLAFAVFKPFLLALLWASVLAIVTYEAYETLGRLVGGRRTVAALGMTLLVLVILVAPFLTLLLHFLDDAGKLAQDFQPSVLEARLRGVLEHPWVKEAEAWIEATTNTRIRIAPELGRLGERIVRPLLPDVGDVLAYFLDLVVGIACVTLALFYFYRDGPAAVRAVRELLPLPEADRRALLHDLKGAMNAAVRGGLVTALAQGFLGFVILFILGIERPVVWACAMSLASLIPLVGTALVWAPMAALIALDGDVPKALVLAGYGAVVIGLADNFLRPLLVGRHMEAHPLLLFFGILGGIMLFGFAGVVLGPVVVAFLNAAARLFRREFGSTPVVVVVPTGKAARPPEEPAPVTGARTRGPGGNDGDRRRGRPRSTDGTPDRPRFSA